jgi:hypothetical protein
MPLELIAILIIVAAYFFGRIHQFVRDARSAMRTDKGYQQRR